MKLFVTGASGFLGRYVVAEALRRGHEVLGLVRREGAERLLRHENGQKLRVYRGDLRCWNELARVLKGCDAVLHLAAAKAGELRSQLTDSVVATENLLEAMTTAGIDRLVLTSTMSVYDYGRLRESETLDEESPLESRPERRETYARSKIAQEELVRRFSEARGLRTTILRPGIVIGPASIWTNQLGIRLKENLWLCFSGIEEPMQMTYVENCAEAILVCAESPEAVDQTFNVVDDDLPARDRYVRELRRRTPRRVLVVRVPGRHVRFVARCIHQVRALICSERCEFPWLVSPPKLDVQLKPLRFSNARLKKLTAWRPRFGLSEALDRCCRETSEECTGGG